MKKTISGNVITFAFEGLDAVVFDATKAHSAVIDRAMMHGFNARIGDAAAIAKNESNGFTVTEAMRRETVLELVNHYESGAENWNLNASARTPAQNPVIAGLAAKAGVTYEEMQAKLATLDVAAIRSL